jgi:hypothetical protein
VALRATVTHLRKVGHTCGSGFRSDAIMLVLERSHCSSAVLTSLQKRRYSVRSSVGQFATSAASPPFAARREGTDLVVVCGRTSSTRVEASGWKEISSYLFQRTVADAGFTPRRGEHGLKMQPTEIRRFCRHGARPFPHRFETYICGQIQWTRSELHLLYCI